MLDLRSQFSQMSRLVQDLSNKLVVTTDHQATESHIPHGNQAEVNLFHPPPQAKPVTSQAAGTSEAVTATDGSDGTEASVSSRHSLA